ncbi:MAG: hypothetical protein ACE5GA_05640, partial [Candidatus Zixiibacteriota bacterium]
MKQGPLHVNLHRKTLLLSVACALALSSPGAAGESGFLFDSLIFTPGAPPLPLDSPTLSSSELVVASPTELVVTYVTPDLEFPFDYRVGVSFPLEFGFGPAVTAEFSDNSPAPDPDLREIQIIDHTVIFRFRRTFFAPEAGQQGVITIRGVTLPTMARAFDAAVFITDRSYLVLAGPGFTNEITLLPAAPASITISPDTALSLQAGESQAFSALTVDQFANPIPDAAPDWSFDLQGDALGELTPGLLLATRAGLGKVTVSIGAIADTSGAIVVTAGALERIDLTLRSPQFSGGGTCGAAQLLMLDQFGNPKETFNGSGILLQLQVDNGTVSPASALVFGPFTNGIIDLSAVGSTGDGLVFSEFLGVTALRASIGNVQSAPVTFTIDGVEALPAPGQRFPASLPANSLLSYDLSLNAPAGTPGAVDSIRIENTSEGPRVFPGPFQLPGVVSAVSAISLNAGEDKLDLSAFASFTQPGVPGGACASTFTTHIPLTVNSDPLLATPGSDTLLTGVRYGSFVGFGFTSPHSVITILSAELQARDGLRWLSLGGLKTAPVPYQAAVDGKLEFTLDIPADTELAEGAHDLRIVATLTDGVFTYPDTALAPDRIVTLSPSSLIPQPGSLAPSIVAPQALQSFTGLFDASDPTRPVVYTGASLELFNAATTIGAAATVESASQLSVTSNPLNIPVELAETELGARFIINFIEFGVRRTDTLEFAAPAVTVGSLSPLTLSD